MVAFTEQLACRTRLWHSRQLHPAGPDGHADGGRHARPRQQRSRAEVAAARDARVPLRGKMGTGWDVANAALFLASDEANFITGVAFRSTAAHWSKSADRMLYSGNLFLRYQASS